MEKAVIASLLLVALLLSQNSVSVSAGAVVGDVSPAALSSKNLIQESTYGPYVVRIYRDDDQYSSLLRITRDGAEVYQLVSGTIRVGPFYKSNKEQVALLKMGRDITGDSQPNLVIADYSGGAHCCLSYHVFSIGEEFKQLGILDAENSDLARFVDLDDDGVLEFATNDWTFEYWNAPFVCSPAPRVYLAYRGREYQVALDFMRQPPPSPAEEAELIKKIRTDPTWRRTSKEQPAGDSDTAKGTRKNTLDALMSILPERVKRSKIETLLRRWGHLEKYEGIGWTNGKVTVPPKVWDHMLNLIYTGHPDLAWQFLERCWPDGKGGMAAFVADFMAALSESSYWPQVRKLLKHP